MPLPEDKSGVTGLYAAPSLTPGCFGSAIAHDPEIGECSSCEFLDLCGIKAEETRERLRQELGLAKLPIRAAKPVAARPEEMSAVAVTVEGRKSPSMKPSPGPRPAGVSKKGAELIRSIERTQPGNCLLANLLTGINPFERQSPRYMAIVCRMLMAGGFTRSGLADAFMKELGWSYGTASSHVSIVCSALPAMGVVKSVGDRMVIDTDVTLE